MSREAYPELISILSDFSTKSFTELQAAAYIALIKMGEESGSAVAGEAGINRSKIYDILGQLEEMGAVQKVSREGKTRYIAVSPDEFLPNLIEKFKDDITKAQEGLSDIKNLEEEIEEAKITLTTLDLNEIDTNEYQYLISSTERHRIKFVDKLPNRDHRPGSEVLILDLNKSGEGRGLILLLNNDDCYIFGTPTGMKVEALHIGSMEMINFIRNIIISSWTGDIPDYIQDEIDDGTRLAFVVDKSIYTKYELFIANEKGEYQRPVTFIISDEFISFIYEGSEVPKMPLRFIHSAELLEDRHTILAKFARPDGKEIGDLHMKVVGNPILIRNILRYIIKTSIE